MEDRVLPSGEPFVEPPVIQSQNGVLNARLVEQTGTITINGQTAINSSTYNSLFPGPTLRFNPGDRLNIDIVNHLTPDAGLAFGPTNLHIHGLHVSPLGNGDNVFLEIDPGQENHYHDNIPANHPEGLYWYHIHHHGFVSQQMFEGLSAMMIVGRPDGGAPELNGLTQHVLAIKNFQTDPTTHKIPDQANEDPNQSLFTVNGLVNPTLTMKPGESQVWSVVDMGNDPHYDISFFNDANNAPQVIWVVAADGEPLTRPEPVTDLKLSPGKRYSFIVSVPNTAPQNSTLSLRTVGFFDGDGQWPAVTLTTVKVQGNRVTPFQIPQHLTPPHNLFHDLSNEPITEHRVAVFDQNPEQGPTAFTINGQTFPNPPVFQARLGTTEEWKITNLSHSIHVFHIHQNNFQIMSMNGIPVPADATHVVIPNVSFPPTGTQSEILVGGTLEDVVDIPAFNPNTNTPGEVVIRMQFKDFTGKYVYHCHIVDHEDNGMMAIVNVVPNDPIVAVGAGENEPPAVRVFDSLTGRLKTTFMAFDPRVVHGGVSVAVANLFGDNRQQIVVGAGPGSAPMVRVFDENGQPLSGFLGTGFLVFDPAFRGGVNVAVSDLDSNGIQEIIVGEGASLSGEPRIRTFNIRNGARTRDFLAFEQGFHGGVRVAAGDVVGNGRIQIIAGRGPGSTPEVKVFREDAHMMADVLAFDQTFRGGVFVATGWVKGFAYQDVLVGSGPGLSLARVLSNLSPQDQGANDSVTLTQWKETSVPIFTTGLHVGSRFDASGTGDDLLVAPGPGNAPRVLIFKTGTLAVSGSFLAFPENFTNGVNFGAIDHQAGSSPTPGLAGEVVSLKATNLVPVPWAHGPHRGGHGVRISSTDAVFSGSSSAALLHGAHAGALSPAELGEGLTGSYAGQAPLEETLNMMGMYAGLPGAMSVTTAGSGHEAAAPEAMMTPKPG